MFGYGCKYCIMDMMRQVEYCKLTGGPTKLECDFAYELCPEYQNARKPIKPKPELKSAPQFTQTSIFGAAGEKPF